MAVSTAKFISLEVCLSQNASLLGPDYTNLGAFEQTGAMHRKIFLSFYNNKGWSVVKLNWIQLFLRKFLGFYKSTHLATIMKERKLSHYKNSVLKDRLEAHLFNPKKIFTSLGNVEKAEAKVFLFPENHTDKNYIKARTRYINTVYRKGDVVLIEGLASGKTISQIEHLKPRIKIYGWEPKDIKKMDMRIPSIQKSYAMKKKFFDMAKAGRFNFPDDCKRLQEIVDYIDPAIGSVEELFKKLQIESQNDPSIDLKERLFTFLMGLVKKMPDARFKHMSLEDCKLIGSDCVKRNQSLVKEMQKRRISGARLFVIAGATHVLGHSSEHFPFPQEVQDFLKKDKFVLVANKNLLTRDVVKLNEAFLSRLHQVEL